MPDDRVTIELTTDARKSLDAWIALQNAIKKTTTEHLAKAAAAGKAVGDGVKLGTDAGAAHLAELEQAGEGSFSALAEHGTRAFGSIAGQIVGFTTAAGAAVAVVDALKEEFDALLQRQKAAGQFQVGAAPAERAALRNLGLGADVSPKEFDETVRKIAADHGADLAGVFSAASSVLSARGNLSASQALRQLEATVALDPSLAAGDLSDLAGAGLDLQKAFGGTPEQAIGALISGQTTSRLVETRDFARNAVPAITNLGAFGADEREASAMFAAITQRSADATGERSGTAAVQFAKQVVQHTAVPELADAGLTERLDFLLSGKGEGEKRRAALVGSFDQTIAQAGVTGSGDLTAEAKQFVALKELLISGSKTRKLYEAALAATPELSEEHKVFEGTIATEKGLGIQSAKKGEEIFTGATQELLGDEETGLAGATLEAYEKFATQLGRFGVGTFTRTSAEMHGGLGGIGRLLGMGEEATFERRVGKGEDPRLVIADFLRGRMFAQEAKSKGASRFSDAELRQAETVTRTARKLLDEAPEGDEKARIESDIEKYERGVARERFRRLPREAQEKAGAAPEERPAETPAAPAPKKPEKKRPVEASKSDGLTHWLTTKSGIPWHLDDDGSASSLAMAREERVAETGEFTSVEPSAKATGARRPVVILDELPDAKAQAKEKAAEEREEKKADVAAKRQEKAQAKEKAKADAKETAEAEREQKKADAAAERVAKLRTDDAEKDELASHRRERVKSPKALKEFDWHEERANAKREAAIAQAETAVERAPAVARDANAGDDGEESTPRGKSREVRRGGAEEKRSENDVDRRRDEKQNETAAAQLREQQALVHEQRESNRLARELIAMTRRGADATREAMRSMERPAIG